MAIPKCFISYSWDSTSHKDWVRFLCEQLQKNGVHTYLDQWDVSLGDQLPEFMETSIRESDFVLLICTNNFAIKANAGQGGVGYEKSIVTGEIFCGSAPDKKFVALLKEGEAKDSLPSYLKSKIYLDFRNNDLFDQSFEDLMRHIYNEPKYTRPPIGAKPKFRPVLNGKNKSVYVEKKSEPKRHPANFEYPINIRPNYDQIESIIKSYGAQLIRFTDRRVVVELGGRTLTYHRPKKTKKLIKESFLKEIGKFLKGG